MNFGPHTAEIAWLYSPTLYRFRIFFIATVFTRRSSNGTQQNYAIWSAMTRI